MVRARIGVTRIGAVATGGIRPCRVWGAFGGSDSARAAARGNASFPDPLCPKPQGLELLVPSDASKSIRGQAVHHAGQGRRAPHCRSGRVIARLSQCSGMTPEPSVATVPLCAIPTTPRMPSYGGGRQRTRWSRSSISTSWSLTLLAWISSSSSSDRRRDRFSFGASISLSATPSERTSTPLRGPDSRMRLSDPATGLATMSRSQNGSQTVAR
jgi:hypothetical protein